MSLTCFLSHSFITGRLALSAITSLSVVRFWTRILLHLEADEEAISDGFMAHSCEQNRNERPNRSTNNGYMVDKAKRGVVSEYHQSNYGEAGLQKI